MDLMAVTNTLLPATAKYFYGILLFIWDRVNPKNDATILDLGVGTGAISSMLYEAGSIITALDCYPNMLTATKEKMPDAAFLYCDFSKRLPKRLLGIL